MEKIEIDLLGVGTGSPRRYVWRSAGLTLSVAKRDEPEADAALGLDGTPAAYVLFGEKNWLGRRAAYVGQTEDAGRRLSEHRSRKNFWTWGAVLAKTEGRFSRLDVEYLEYLGIKTAVECGNADLMDNCQIPAEPWTEPKDKERLRETFEKGRTLLSLAGFDVFERKLFELPDVTRNNPRDIMSRMVAEYASERPAAPDEPCPDETDELVSYVAEGPDFRAEAIPLADGSVVLSKGGFVSREESPAAFASQDVNHSNRMITGWPTLPSLEDAAEFVAGKRDASIWRKRVRTA